MDHHQPGSPDEFHYDAFISYSHADSAWVQDVLLPRLEGEGLHVCIDTRDFDIGVPSVVNMENAVERSRKTLLVLTPNWVASEWTGFESLLIQTEDPAGRGRRILPLMVQDCQDQLPKRLKMFTYLDLTDPAQLDFQMERLVAAVRARPAQPSPPQAAAAAQTAAPPAGAAQGDFDLEEGLSALGQLLALADDESQLAFSVLESRLLDNLRDERLYGSTETLRSDRARVVGELNRLALDRVGRSFNELSKTSDPLPMQISEPSGGPSPKANTPNPFGDTGRITDQERFFNREELLRQIFEELNKGVNLSLVGESQVGKSSLLSMVCAVGPDRLGLPTEAFVYLNPEVVDNEDDFYSALCDELGLEQSRGYQLTRALRGKRYVLCLDEAEVLTWKGFTVRMRSQLRGLADGPAAPLKLVIASRSPLAHLFPDSPELNSPLAGICRQLEVGPFPPDVARAFLVSRLHGTGVTFADGEIARLIAESGGHPARLQGAAAALYNAKSHTQGA